MDYFFAVFFSILFYLMIGFFVIIVIMDVAKHMSKRKLTENILRSSEERRQKFIYMDSRLISYEKKLLWLLLAILPVLALSIYLFLPDLLWLPIALALLCIIVLEDRFYRKSFLKAIDKN